MKTKHTLGHMSNRYKVASLIYERYWYQHYTRKRDQAYIKVTSYPQKT